MRNYEGTLRLQGVGMVEGIKAKNIKVGDILVWNYGGTEKVLTMEFTKTGKSLKLTVLADDQKTYERTLRVERIVAVKELNSEIIETEEISQESIVNKEIENTLSNNMEVEEMKKESKVLIFEGAGWDKATSSINSGVGNCRIRTRIRNKAGRLIYLEMGGFEADKKYNKENFNIRGRVDHIFYCDSEWDSNKNHSKDLKDLERFQYEYNKENILNFVNENLNCNFTDIQVINDNSMRVHDTKEPLSDCSIPGYKPYKDIEININELSGINPIITYKNHNFAEYRINYNYVKRILYIKSYMDLRSIKEQTNYKNLSYKIYLRWDNTGKITSAELSAIQNFACFGLYIEDLNFIIESIKESNIKQSVAV